MKFTDGKGNFAEVKNMKDNGVDVAADVFKDYMTEYNEELGAYVVESKAVLNELEEVFDDWQWEDRKSRKGTIFYYRTYMII